MRTLLWCFFTWRGQLNRHEFALAVAFLLLAIYLLSPIGAAVMELSLPLNGSVTDRDLATAHRQGTQLVYLLQLWPSYALQAKRLRDIGISPTNLVGATAAAIALLLFSPGLYLGFAATTFLFLLCAKGKPQTSHDRSANI